MSDIVSQIQTYLHGIWRRRWYVIAVAWFVCGAGWTGVASLPDRYEASARLYADMDSMLNPLMRGMAVEMNLFQQLDVLQRTLLNRPNLEKVVLMTDLDLQVHTDVEKEALLDRLGKSIVLKQQLPSRNLFLISYQDADPQLAKRVVQAILQIFVESSLGASRQDMDATRKFLDAQIREAEQHLGEAEAKLIQFKREKMGFLPGEGSYYSNLQRMAQGVAKTQGEIAEAEMMRDELRQQLAAVPQFLELQTAEQSIESGPGRGPESDLQIRIFDMEKAIDSLLMRYTDKHPDVVIARKRVEQLKKEQEEEQKARLAALAGPGGDSEATNGGGPATRGSGKSLVPNPLYEKIKLQLVQHEASLAAVKRRLQDGQAEREKWAKMASLVPEVEAELARINRDYALVKTNYDQLRLRQESARMARELETKAQKVQYRIIDPPKVPLKPSAPKRPLLLAGVLVVGLGAGAAFAFLLTQLNQTYSTVAGLRNAFTLPVLGSITIITWPADRWRKLREMIGFSLVTSSLFAAFIGLVAIETIGPSTIVAYIKDLGLDYVTALLGLA